VATLNPTTALEAICAFNKIFDELPAKNHGITLTKRKPFG